MEQRAHSVLSLTPPQSPVQAKRPHILPEPVRDPSHHLPINKEEEPSTDPPASAAGVKQESHYYTCPVPGCSCRVKRLWNHLFITHKKRGHYTGLYV